MPEFVLVLAVVWLGCAAGFVVHHRDESDGVTTDLIVRLPVHVCTNSCFNVFAFSLKY